jgi:hypothetical protein
LSRLTRTRSATAGEGARGGGMREIGVIAISPYAGQCLLHRSFRPTQLSSLAGTGEQNFLRVCECTSNVARASSVIAQLGPLGQRMHEPDKRG